LRGLTKKRFYSTASYKSGDLRGISMSGTGVAGWNFAGQNLENASFSGAGVGNADFSQANLTAVTFEGASLVGTDLTDAVVTGASFANTTLSHGFTKEQLYSTASYKSGDLRGISLRENPMTGWNFAGQNLENADFSSADLANADFSQANLTGASLAASTLTGADLTDAIVAGARLRSIAEEQLYSTASYKSKDLHGIDLGGNLTGWNLTGQNLTNATFTTLAGADLTDAVVAGARLGGIAEEQLYSTASYKSKDLHEIELGGNLTGWNLAGQNLTNASLRRTTLTNADLSGANLANASFEYADLTDSNLSQANLANVVFRLADLTDSDLSLADLRGADVRSSIGLTVGNRSNTILPDGLVEGLELGAGERLVVRDHDLGVRVEDALTLAESGALELRLADAEWGSTIVVEPGVVPLLAGTLALSVDEKAILRDLVGATFSVFDWNGQLPPDEQFQQVVTAPGQVWDISRLYTTGEVQLMSIPEPGTIVLVASALLLVGLTRCLGPPFAAGHWGKSL